MVKLDEINGGLVTLKEAVEVLEEFGYRVDNPSEDNGFFKVEGEGRNENFKVMKKDINDATYHPDACFAESKKVKINVENGEVVSFGEYGKVVIRGGGRIIDNWDI